MHAGETFGLPDPAAFGQVLEDRDGRLLGQAAMGQGRPLALREAHLAGVAEEEPDLFVLAVAVADRQVAGVAPAVKRAGRILAAEAREVAHGCEPGRVVAGREAIGRKPHDTLRLDERQ
jgi:hypothetical protein